MEGKKKGEKIEINAAGYCNGRKKAIDGVTYFGSDEGSSVSVISDTCQKENDYVYLDDEAGISQKQFKIFYSVKDDQYYIKNLGDESGTFIRVDTKIIVKQGYMITFGKFHIVMNYKAEAIDNICIRVINGVQLESEQ